MTKHLLVFGPGYTALPIMARAKAEGWLVTATCRNDKSRIPLEQAGYRSVPFGAGQLNGDIPVSHILTSIAPLEAGDPVLPLWNRWLKQQTELCALHYFSSTNVYGDKQGAWVDETTKPEPTLTRGTRRLEAEIEWQKLATSMALPCFKYRLAGIYGPGRNSFTALKAGKARNIIKPGQVFGRIHRDDIANTVWAALNSEHSGGAFNLTDNLPAPPLEVIEAAAMLLGVAAPPAVNLADAGLSEMGKSFYAENKRVRNDKIKRELGVELLYPTYKEGLAALLEEFS